ncbi:hypothetical protein [Pectobacterium polaris]|uniref:hypothetical protein n=1 Tax=Pectobacterium polaris TaxID=2042057 RepID=UPI001581830D|nr:hypothetical protein [Pectobacterium polaris]
MVLNKKYVFPFIFIALGGMLSSCSIKKQGLPLHGGIISTLENRYPQDSKIRLVYGPSVVLHISVIHFQEIKKLCEEREGTFEQYTMDAGWCIGDNDRPQYVFFKDIFDNGKGTISIAEKGDGVSDESWIAHTKESYKYFWAKRYGN